jgi:thiamine biosynthesis protein ThiI
MTGPRLHIVLRSPEITLKGRNQGDFWSQLRANVRHVLRRLKLRWPVKMTKGRLYVEAHGYSTESLGTVVDALQRVAGVTSLAPAIRLRRGDLFANGELDRATVEELVVNLAREKYRPESTFAVRVHRVDKRFPLASSELETWLGRAIRKHTEWDRVRLDNPDQTFSIDIYSDGMLFYGDRPRGIGGLPVGTSGPILGLLSGGIDSPVASYLLARRGCTVDWIHMSASQIHEGDFETSVPGQLARQLSRYTLRSRLFVVPYTHFDLALSGRTTGHEPVLFRRFLFRVAEAVARKTGAISLVTGDSLSQVASQTIENLIATDKAIDLPILRPLVGFDKNEIMKIAETIGTYETSILPYKDCCALYSRRVKTRSRDRTLSSIEDQNLPNYDELIELSLADTMWAGYDCGEVITAHRGMDGISGGARAAQLSGSYCARS